MSESDNITFFTGEPIDTRFLMIQIKDYLGWTKNHPDRIDNREVILIDTGINALRNAKEYDWEKDLNFKQFLDTLPENHFAAFDYPPSINKEHSELFIQKSWENAKKYCNHPQFIPVVQYQTSNYFDFIVWFEKYNNLEITSGILGIGNLKPHKKLNSFLRHALSYSIHKCSHNQIHFYGLTFGAFKYIQRASNKAKISISVDNTNYIFPTPEMKHKYGFKRANRRFRQEYYDSKVNELVLDNVYLREKSNFPFKWPSRNCAECNNCRFLEIAEKYLGCGVYHYNNNIADGLLDEHYTEGNIFGGNCKIKLIIEIYENIKLIAFLVILVIIMRKAILNRSVKS